GSLDEATGFCATSSFLAANDYVAGSLNDGTAYLLSSFQAADAIDYLCDDEEDWKLDPNVIQMIFDGTWYCYYSVKLEPNQTALGESLISGDYCSKLYGSRRHVVKISDPR
ncbi:hypothetical protein AAVH_07679, partial [Aphelenchoides avenae]